MKNIEIILNKEQNNKSKPIFKYIFDVLQTLFSVSATHSLKQLLVLNLQNYKIDKYAFSQKNKILLKHSIVIGYEGGLFALMNTLNSKDEPFIISQLNQDKEFWDQINRTVYNYKES